VGERKDYRVVFERIGRSRSPEALTARLTGVDISTETGRDAAAEALFQHCRRFLASSEFTVTIDFTTGQVWIDAGRFGQGRLEKA
jgi:hypothetical protein